MNGIIKEELGFQGPIMSDWAAMINGVQVRILRSKLFFETHQFLHQSLHWLV